MMTQALTLNVDEAPPVYEATGAETVGEETPEATGGEAAALGGSCGAGAEAAGGEGAAAAGLL